jgi:hypothetical protein
MPAWIDHLAGCPQCWNAAMICNLPFPDWLARACDQGREIYREQAERMGA